MRKYNTANTEREMRFEHALVSHISGKGFHIAARVFPSKRGDTLVMREETLGGERVTRFFAVYEMLEGEDKYTWINNRCTDRSTRTARGCWPGSTPWRTTSTPATSPASSRRSWTSSASCRSIFEGYAAAVARHGVRRVLPRQAAGDPRGRATAASAIGADLEGMPRVPVHCDYHPGNLKWVDEQGVGLFDFDWSKLDYRLFDVAQGIVYFCSSWEGHDDGELRLDKAAIFVRGYQDEAARFDGARAR